MIKTLLVDDDPVIQNILTAMLQEKGIAVLVAHDGKEALELTDFSLPDCIFLDVFLTDMSGVEVAREIEKICESKNTAVPKIIFVSANSLDEIKSLDASLSIEYYLRKPFNSASVKAVLSEVFPDQEF